MEYDSAMRAIMYILGLSVAVCFDEAEHAGVEFCDVDTGLRHCWTNSCVFSFAWGEAAEV